MKKRNNADVFNDSHIKVPFVLPEITNEDKKAILSTLNQNLLTDGPKLREFENKFAKFTGAKYAIGVSNATAALQLSLKAIGIGKGDEVIIPDLTFVASANAILFTGATPIIADIDKEDYNISIDSIKNSLTNKTKAIMPVHIAGGPADMDAILEIGKTHGIPIIEDAAQAHGAEWNGTKVGAIGLGGIFSFQTSKNMTAGEGGAIISNDDDFMDACFSYHNCGRVKGGEWYEHSHLGGNFRLNAMAASMLFPQIESLQQDMEIRDKNALMLDEAVHSINGIDRVKQENGTTRHAHHLYITKYDASAFNGIAREAFFKAMQAEGVYTYAGYTPLYREKLFITNADEYPWLKDRDYGSLSMPNTELIADEQAVWLKQNHLLGSEEDTKDIINAFEKVTDAMNKEPDLFLK